MLAHAAADPVHRARSRQLLRAGGRARLRTRRSRSAGPGRRGTASIDRLGRAGDPAVAGAHRRHHPLAPRPLRRRGPAARGDRAPTSSPTRSFKLWWERGDGLDDTPSDALDIAASTGRARRRGAASSSPPSDGGCDEMRDEMRSNEHTPRPTRRVDDAEVVTLAGREWVSLHTPGHTPDHLCLFDPVDGVVLSGDHVLPTITPHIGGDGRRRRRPAGRVLRTRSTGWRRCRTSRVALPAHGHPFHDLAGRVTEIEEHHDERLDRLRDGVERARPAGVGARADAAPVLRAGVGLDGRVARRTPTSSTCASAARPTRSGSTACCCFEVVES